MGGSVKPVVSAVGGGGGKSAPQAQNNYGSAYQAPPAQVYQPNYGSTLGSLGNALRGATAPTQPMMGSKSSGAGQGGYGGAPAFQQPQPEMGMPMAGGKSLAGVTPYPEVPGFGQAQLMQQPIQQTGNYRPQFQQPRFNPYQQAQFNPYQQPMQQPGFSGLQDLFNVMMGQYQQQQMPQQMPQYQSPSSMYRPNMQQVQQNLSRVRPSVQKQRQDEQAARIKQLEDELAALRQPSSYDYGGGG